MDDEFLRISFDRSLISVPRLVTMYSSIGPGALKNINVSGGYFTGWRSSIIMLWFDEEQQRWQKLQHKSCIHSP